MSQAIMDPDEVRRFADFWRTRLPADALLLTDLQTLQLLAVLFHRYLNH